MKKVTSIQQTDIRCNQSIERSLLEFLKTKSEGRYSRLEAYCDLLARINPNTYTYTANGVPLQLKPGQFISSISELSRKWQWQRATVRQFIEGLKSIQQLDFKPVSKMFIFTIYSAQYLSIRIGDVEDIRLFSEMQFGRFLNGTATAEETAECMDFYFQYLLDNIDDNCSIEERIHDISNQKYATFKSYLSSVFHLQDNKVQYPVDMEYAIRNFMGSNQICTWYKLMGMIERIRNSKNLSHESVELEKNVTGVEAQLTRWIYKFYTSLVNSNNSKSSAPENSTKEAYLRHSKNDCSTSNPE